MVFLVILFFFGLSAGTIGKIKGGSFVLWFMIGFALPFFGTLAALFYRRDSDGLRRRCDTCAAILPITEQVCRRCGADLEFPSEALAPRPT